MAKLQLGLFHIKSVVTVSPTGMEMKTSGLTLSPEDGKRFTDLLMELLTKKPAKVSL